MVPDCSSQTARDLKYGTKRTPKKSQWIIREQMTARRLIRHLKHTLVIVRTVKQSKRWYRSWFLGFLIFFLYGISIWILLKFVQYSVSYNGLFFNPFHLPKSDLLEQIELDCDGILSGNSSTTERLKTWAFPRKVDVEIEEAKDQCSKINELFYFNKKPLSDEEANFPLAYGLVVYKQITQVLLMLSSFYQPQNSYCIAYSGSSGESFKKIIKLLPKCFPNIHVMQRPAIAWGSFEIINSTYACLDHLSRQEHNWKYYQYLSGVDVPLKTNFEMVQIFKALNGNVNVEFKEYEPSRALKNIKNTPLPLYKSSLSPLIPRATADYIVNSDVTKRLLKFLKNTKIPDESFWGTLTGNFRQFPVPGGFNAEMIMKVRHELEAKQGERRGLDLAHIGWYYYISRKQIWQGSYCFGKLSSGSCVYGIRDVAGLMKQPALVAHKFYIDFQPAGYVCALKEIRRRTYSPTPFDATFYSELPQYELMKGIRPENLTHPTWL